MPQIIFKVEFNGKIKICKKELKSYADLLGAVEASYPSLKGNTSMFEIQFKDKENEKITISNDDDLTLALDTMEEMKLFKFYIASDQLLYVSVIPNPSPTVEVVKKAEEVKIEKEKPQEIKELDKVKWGNLIRQIAITEVKAKLTQSLASLSIQSVVEKKQDQPKVEDKKIDDQNAIVKPNEPIPINNIGIYTGVMDPKLMPTRDSLLVKELIALLQKVSKFVSGKNNKKMAEGVTRKNSVQIVSNPGAYCFAKFTVVNNSTFSWPDVYILSKRRGNIEIGHSIYTIKLAATQKADFSFKFKAPMKLGKHNAKIIFYYYNGSDAFVSFGKLITINVTVTNDKKDDINLIQNSSQLEKERLGDINDCLAALNTSNNNIEEARKILLCQKGLLSIA